MRAPPVREASRPRLRSLPVIAPRHRGDLPAWVALIAVAVPLFTLAYANGGFDLSTRAIAAVAIWWVLALGLVFRLLPVASVPRAALAVAGLVAGYTLWLLVSIAWAPSAERAFAEFNRATLLLGILLLVVLASRRATAHAWADGVALALTAVALVALASRCFPGLFPSRGLAEFSPAWQVRLGFPVGYWNGLAILVALAVPLLLRRATEGRPAVRAAAVAPFPVLASVVYLASSRGGAATAVAGALAFIVLTPRRWAAAGALVVGAAGVAGAVAVLVARDDLVNGPLGADAVTGQGRSAAALIMLACLACGALYGLVVASGLSLAVPRWFGRSAAAASLTAGLALVVAIDPIERFREFKEPPGAVQHSTTDFVQSHLTSANGSGRWQLWSAAVDQWRERPLAGEGAGTFESRWAEHREIDLFARDAHSLYAEALGEVGLVGFALLVGALLTGLAVGARRALQGADESARLAAAAATAVAAAFAVAAGVDWVWELTAVSAVGMVALALAAGPATAPFGVTRRLPGAVSVGAILVAWLAVCAHGVALVSSLELDRSETAAASGDGAAALEHARAARAIQPWAASPYLQIALVEEQLGRLPAAREAIGQAIDRDRRDWRLWLTAARLEAKAGAVPEARRMLERARGLNPRSRVLAELGA